MFKFLDEKVKKESEKYNKWFVNFGFFLKEGVCLEYVYKFEFVELLCYELSLMEIGKLMFFCEYVARMFEG